MEEKKKLAWPDKVEKASESVSRREALKRIARNAGGVAIIAALPSWALADKEDDDVLLAYYYSYYSSTHYYHSYVSYSYYSGYSSRYNSYGYSSYGYSSYGGGRGRGSGATCFIDTLLKNKKK